MERLWARLLECILESFSSGSFLFFIAEPCFELEFIQMAIIRRLARYYASN